MIEVKTTITTEFSNETLFLKFDSDDNKITVTIDGEANETILDAGQIDEIQNFLDAVRPLVRI